MGHPTYLGCSGKSLELLMISTVVSFGFIALGYDNGFLGSLLDGKDLVAQFPQIDTVNTTGQANRQNAQVQGTVVASYTLGAFVGSLLCIFIGDPLGRRKTTAICAISQIIGAILQASSFSLPQLIVGRIFMGIGIGMFTATVPNWQAESSSSAHRGAVVVFDSVVISFGLAAQAWIAFGTSHAAGSFIWRFPMAVSGFWPIVVLVFVFLLPESPRWLAKHGKEAEARQVLSALYAQDPDSSIVNREMAEILETVRLTSQGKFGDIFRSNDLRLRHRLIIAVACNAFQQLNGINAIGSYLGTILTDYLQLTGSLAMILSACVFSWQTLCSPIGVLLVDRVGRRVMMMIGALGMGCCMIVIAGGISHIQDKSAVAAALAFVFLFSYFFPNHLLSITFLYASEISPLQYRVPITSIASGALWLANFAVVESAPAGFATIQYRYYIIWGVINICLIFPTIYLFFPETNGLQLEEVDQIFQEGGNAFTIVKKSKRSRRQHKASGKDGEAMGEMDPDSLEAERR